MRMLEWFRSACGEAGLIRMMSFTIDILVLAMMFMIIRGTVAYNRAVVRMHGDVIDVRDNQEVIRVQLLAIECQTKLRRCTPDQLDTIRKAQAEVVDEATGKARQRDNRRDAEGATK